MSPAFVTGIESPGHYQYHHWHDKKLITRSDDADNVRTDTIGFQQQAVCSRPYSQGLLSSALLASIQAFNSN